MTGGTIQQNRLGLSLVTLFAALALVLALNGLYPKIEDVVLYCRTRKAPAVASGAKIDNGRLEVAPALR